MADSFGYNFPFFSPISVLSPQAGVRLIKNDVKQLLLTSMGERVMRPEFGTPIRKTPFDLQDEETLFILRNQIVSAIDQYEKRVAIRDIRFVSKPDSSYLEIIIIMSLTRDPNTTLDVTINTAPGDTSQPQQGQ